MNLSRKFALWLLLFALGVGVLAVSGYYRAELAEEEQKLGILGATTARVVIASLDRHMLRGETKIVRDILHDLEAEEPLSGVLLIDPDGVVKAATDRSREGKRLLRSDAGCRECHDRGSERRDFLLAPQDLFRWAEPIRNKAACHSCHDPAARNNGLLIIDFSIRAFKDRLRDNVLRSIAIFSAALVAFLAFFLLLSRALVVRKLERIGAAMKAYQGGDFSARVPVESRDEIGGLAADFNALSDTIGERNREKDGLLAQLNAANENLQREIAGRTRWEQALQEQKMFAEQLIENSAVATFVVDPQHTVVLWNKACEALSGAPAADMIGTGNHWRPFYPGKRQTLADVIIDGNLEDLPRLYDVSAHSVLIPSALRAEGWYRNLNGKDRYIIFDAAPVYGSKGELTVVIETLQDVTAQKMMEDALAVSEDRLRTVIATQPECVKLAAPDGTVLEMNPAGLEMIEADSPEQIVGRSMMPLVAPEHRDAFEALAERVLNGEPGMLEFELIGLKGTRRWLETRAAPLRNARGEIFALLGVTRDITERKQWEKKLSEQLRFSQLLMDTIPIPVFYKNAQGVYLGCNRAFVEFIGLPKERLIGKSVYDIAPKELADIYHQRDAELFEHPGVQVYEFGVRRPDGSEHTVVFHKATYAGAEGKVAGLIGAMLDITERKRAEEAIRETYHALEAVINASPLAITALDPGGIVTMWNPAAERIFGWTAEEAIGRFNPFVPEEKKEEFKGLRDRVLNGESYTGVEVRRRRKDGTLLDFSLSAAPLRDAHGNVTGVVGVLADITERRRAEAEREKLIDELQKALESVYRSQKEWQDTFDSITDEIAIINADFTILKANRAFAAHYSLHPRNVIGRTCLALVHGADGPIANCPHAVTMKEKRAVTEEVLDPHTKRIFLVSTFPYRSPGGDLIGSIHVSRDITDQREAETRLIMSERLAALGQMASGIAHEINNPLASIAGCSEGLLSRVRKGQWETKLFETYLTIIQEEVFRCKSITTAMLSFVRKTTYEKKDIDINAMLNRTLEIIGFQGRLKKVEVRKQYGEIPAVHGSEGELRQVFLAVITNALDAMQDDGLLTLGTGLAGGYVVVRISDTGAGIPAEIMTKIFDPFFTTKSDRSGTGLGLSIARKIVLNHNGTIDVSSGPDSGATFSIALPL